MKKKFLISLLVILFSLNYNTFAKTMKDLPYHHLPMALLEIQKEVQKEMKI